ncbi:MAG: (2Fe-2S)-binding protein [Planctomycetia bacterium]|nr:(2Fe-2S)-binding protein [Planctomycetia bacterium]
MDLDDELCLCFHVSKRKVLNYLRIERPRSASQLSECQGAGTGCGWCRSYLRRLFDQAARGESPSTIDRSAPAVITPANETAAEPSAADYALARTQYVRSGGGTPPPGATPIEPT